MSLFRVLIGIFFLCPIIAQSSDFSKYLSFVNKAEEMIVKEQHEKACLYFDSALKVWDKPFAIDLYNYLKCANSVERYADVKDIASRLVSLGCDLKFFEQPTWLAKFRTTTFWPDFFTEYPDRKLKYIRNNDWKTRVLIERILAQDQFLRVQSHDYSFLKDSLYDNDEIIRGMLFEMFKAKFPNEYDYGIFLQDDTTLLPYEPLHLTILHNYGKFDTSVVHNANIKTHDFTNLLLQYVKKGQMHPQEFAYLNDRSGAYMLGKGHRQADGFLVNIDGKMYFNNYAEDKVIDRNRTELGLVSYEEEKSKAIYMVQHKNNFILFRHMGYIVRMKHPDIPQSAMKFMFKSANINED